MTIEYYIKCVYGKDINYLVGATPRMEREVHELTKNKTLTIENIRILERWGIEFKQVLEPQKDTCMYDHEHLDKDGVYCMSHN